MMHGHRMMGSTRGRGLKQHTLWQILGKLLPYFKDETKRFVLTLVMVAFKVSADVSLLLLSRGVLNVVENFMTGGARGPKATVGELIAFALFRSDRELNVADLPALIVMMAVAIAVHFVAGYFRGYIPGIMISNVAFAIRRALYGHLQCMDLYFFDRTRSGEISSRLTNDINQGVSVFGMTITVFIFQIILFFASFYFMLRVSLPLTGAAIAVGLLFVINMRFFVPRLRQRSRTVQEKLGQISGEVAEKFSGIKVMQSFTNEQWEMAIFTDRISEHRQSLIDMARLSSFTSIFGQTIPFMGTLAILGIGAYQVINGELTIANLTFFYMMRDRLFMPFQMFAHLSQQMALGLGGLDRVFEFFSLRSKVTDRPGAAPLSEVKGDVEFRNVSFAYEGDRRQHVLSNISFTAPQGTSVALVGASGAGKTTMVDLLSRFYDPTEGCILIDHKDIRGYTLQSLRDNIGVVMQEAILFSGSIKENVLYGNPSSSDRDVEESLKMANAWDFVSDMPDGMKTVIGERGVSLSGGQRQRVAIARAFLKNPRILVLDEATSALDSVSELFVQEAIERLMKNRTTFVIAHRLSTIANVNQIVVLKDGAMVEQGTHEDLLAKKGAYAEFYSQQFDSLARRR
ncbi:MAG: ATP-binding cassette domain-containing protein [Chitinivibrionales bacterium]|nr:ATP-binding cassette domain-containing protein [Chitinivibrionales bacterium]MBD3396052.1 ATP-binding cassette domain-containing protein [Chitinivibrionales bacterium]